MSPKVGLFGGTFNPVHNAHLKVAETALQQFQLEKVIFIPSKIPPHKQEQNMPPPEIRYHMVELAIEGHSKIEISSIELNRKGPSYTVDTIVSMKRKYPKTAFIVGADNLLYIETWKNPEKLLNSCPFIVAPRRGFGHKDFNRGIFKGKDIRFLDMEEIDISSTRIREKFEQGLAVDHLIPSRVKRYIEQQNLYRRASQTT